ncbi:sensor histidine kinase [Angustibacter luteus]|uniref:histidine kinase n=1 Tax=Angustibacter luteus TaxID=658456 RepID=A0ABW1JCN0_9ACTN
MRIPRPHPLRRLRAAPAATARGWQHVESALLRWSEPAALSPDPRRRLRLTLAAWTVAVALSVIAFGTSGEVYDVDTLGYGLMPFVGLLAGLPFGLVLTRPTLGLLISEVSAFALAITLPVADSDPWTWLTVQSLVIFALLFAVALREPLQRVVGAWAATVLLFAWGSAPDVRTGWMVGVTIIVVVGLLVSRLARTNRALSRQTAVSSAETQRRLVLEERARIARDLHDIVAHHMSLVVVQAETAGYRHPDLPDVAREELESISASARAALAETRALLAVLRNEDDEAEHAPQPGLELLAELVEGARRAGQDVEADVRLGGDALRPGTSLAAYRIVQESLANAARHAPGAAVRVVVARDGSALRVSVVNDRPPEPVAADLDPDGAGHGIIGMRERAGAEGGSLDAAPSADGGFVVRAELPLGAP